LIIIDKVMVSDEVVEAQFVCDLNKCKGGCCEDGDAGAPLTGQELDIIVDQVDQAKSYMTKEGLAELERTGLYRYDKSFGWVTPTVEGKICAYGFRDEKGIIKCAFEQAYNDGKMTWKKPISCHLYPVKRSTGKYGDYEMLNYEPRDSLCAPACSLGEKLQVPVYRFLKEPISRAYGDEFYRALDRAAQEYYERKADQ
jgi:hypothetical protein